MSFFFLTLETKAQTIQIQTKNDQTSENIPYITISISVFNSLDSLFYYTKTDDRGISLIDLSSYHPYDSIVLAANSIFYEIEKNIIRNKEIVSKTVIFSLKENIETLKEVNISSKKAPIIYKKDSIDIDVNYYAELTDENLEETLKRVNDLSIDKNGEIIVQNKKIQKILINGEEVSDFGSALITRSINSEDVNKIQVRLDEKNTSLKNSIVDDEKLVILDISLKENVDLGLFGKLAIEQGLVNNNYPIGGLFNTFSIPNKGYALQVFGEKNNFGEQTISLEQIKNIGQEAHNKMFSTPVQYDDLIGRETFNEDIYGLENIFYKRHNTIIGFALKKKISKISSLFIGSFNEIKNHEDYLMTEQFILQQDTKNQLSEKNNTFSQSSINKIEYRFNKKKTKLKADINLEIDKIQNNNNYEQEYDNNTSNYKYDNQNSRLGIYGNLLYEHIFKKKVSIQVKLHGSFVQKNNNISNKNNDASFPNYLQNFQQEDNSNNPFFVTQTAINKRIKKGNIKIGYLYFHKSNETQLISNVDDFKDLSTTGFQKNTIFFNINKRWNTFKIKFEPGLSTIQTNNTIYNFFEYNSKINLLLPLNIDCDLIAKQQVSNFELTALTKGKRLITYNQILVPPNSNYKPQLEQNFEIHLYRNFHKIGMIISAASLFGQKRNGDNFFSETFPIITVQRDQNINTLFMSVLRFDKSFLNQPLQLSLELGNISNGQENNTIDNQLYNNITNRNLAIFKINSTYKKKRFNFESTVHLSKTLFENNNSKDEMNSISLKGKINTYHLQRRLVMSPAIQFLTINGLQNLNFINFNYKLYFTLPKIKSNIYLKVNNILNNSSFLKQELNPIIYSYSYTYLTERNFRIGFQYKF